jgi:hypothetical protein
MATIAKQRNTALAFLLPICLMIKGKREYKAKIETRRKM